MTAEHAHTEQSSPETAVRAALDALQRLAEVHDRPELGETCREAVGRLDSDAFRVVVMGEYKQGKSSLINALLGAPVAGVDDDIATAAPLEVVFHQRAAARRWIRDPATGSVVAESISPARAAVASTDPESIRVRVGLPRRLLEAGIMLVDTPGVGGLASANGIVAASALARAHAVLFVTDVSQELTRSEADALVDACRRCPRVIMVETKIDLTPCWREIVAADRAHLARLDLDIPILTVSSHLRDLALERNDDGINAESGFAELIGLLHNELAPAARQITIDGAVQSAARVYAHLREPLLAEIDTLGNATDADAADHLAATRANLEAFGARARRWQQTMSDGITDLASAVDVDLRNRFRVLGREADLELDDVDPDAVWHEYEPELYRRTAEAMGANLDLLRERATELCAQLAALIADDEHNTIDLEHAFADVELESNAERKAGKEIASSARAQQAFRAGYGGAMPIMAVGGMALGVLGLGTLVLPLAAIAGVMAGRKALTDERDRHLTQRQQQAKIAAKKYLDEALFRASNERKQSQRSLQRLVRDHFGTRVKELAGTHTAAVGRAESAATASDTERRTRRAAARAELDRVEQVAAIMASGS